MIQAMRPEAVLPKIAHNWLIFWSHQTAELLKSQRILSGDSRVPLIQLQEHCADKLKYKT